jgi:hypothetical protein
MSADAGAGPLWGRGWLRVFDLQFDSGVVCTFYLAGSQLSSVWLETHSLTFRRLHVSQARARARPVFAVAFFCGGVDPLATLLGEGRESSSRGFARARLFDRAAAFSAGTSSTFAAVSSGGVPAEPASECSASAPDFVLDGLMSDGWSLESPV